MNILLITPLYSTHYDAGWFWLRALNRLGHSIQVWDYRLDVDPPPFFHYPEVTLVLKGENVDPMKLPGLRLNYWPDALERTPGIEEVLKRYDRVFTPVRPTPDWMEWLPTGWDPAIHADMKVERLVPTIYVGTANSPYKVKTIGQISPVGIWGNGWGEPSRPMYLHDLVGVLNMSRVLIDVHQSPTVGLNRKFFEMISCGFTIVDRVPGVEDILGWRLTQQVSFKDPHEAKELIKYYLERPEERSKVWQLEREKIQEYTYQKAVERVLSHVHSI